MPIQEIHLEPRVARLETGLETLTKNVNEIAVQMRDNANSTNSKLDQLAISITEARAPKSTDWTMLISLAFLILAIGSAVYFPIAQRIDYNKEQIVHSEDLFKSHFELQDKLLTEKLGGIAKAQDLVNERVYARILKLEEVNIEERDKELEELLLWRQKAMGLVK